MEHFIVAMNLALALLAGNGYSQACTGKIVAGVAIVTCENVRGAWRSAVIRRSGERLVIDTKTVKGFAS